VREVTAQSEVQVTWGVGIPMRDGVCLNANLYLPGPYFPGPHEASAPAIFSLTPYVAQVNHDRGMYFARHGYPFLAVDVRGRGGSPGTFRPSASEAQDGHDVVEWLATQPYCNGQVAMCGGSYVGYTQWATAASRPTHLATIVPVAAPFRGGDSPMRNNTFPTYAIRWLTLVAGRSSQDKVFADRSFWSDQYRRWFESGKSFRTLDAVAGHSSAVFQEWISHPERGPYWDQFNPTPQQYAGITIPVLTITGMYDSDQLGALMHYREHLSHSSSGAPARHFLIIGPWDHAGTRTPKRTFGGIEAGPASLVDLQELHLQWYAWTMQSGPRPHFLKNNVMYYVLGADRWRHAESLEAITERVVAFYLQSSVCPTDVFHSGLLATAPKACEPDRYVYDPRDVSLAKLECEVDPDNLADDRMTYAAAGKHLIYHTDPFDRDIEFIGFVRLSVWLSIDRPDTDFQATLYEVRADGTAIRLTSDCMRARYRESFREQKLIATEEPLRYDFRHFTFISCRVRRGHRLRLVFGPINSVYMQKNYNSGGNVADESMLDARTVTVRLFHDDAHPSAIYIPFGREERGAADA
jgi:uncharacterized protein